MLLDIHEPGQTPQPHERVTAIGIDLGTTHSLVAVVKPSPFGRGWGEGLGYSEHNQALTPALSQRERELSADIIPDAKGRRLLPSVVAYEDITHTGYDALTSPAAIRSIKRLMGKGVKDIRKISGSLPYNVVESEGMVRLKTGNRLVTPVEISSEILRALKHQAEEALETSITKAVITVPAYFDDAARAATKDAARLAGLEVLRLVNEPTAAALAYGLDNAAEGVYAVYDLGGGTFDISLLRMEKGVFQVLATGGDAMLGGDDFDHEIAELFLWYYKKLANRIPTMTPDSLKPVLTAARHAKEYLSSHEHGIFDVEIEGQRLAIPLNRAELDRAIRPFIDKTIAITHQVFEDAGVLPNDIKGIVLVGGSTRVPLIRTQVEAAFQTPVLDNVNPDEVVALGAALQAASLTGNSDTLLLDVLPLSLGMETMGGIVEKIIHRNTPIPVSVAQEFTTYQDSQTGMKLHIVQGEREMAVQCRSLAQFELKGIPPMVAGAARVKVTFTVDADGVLSVSAIEETTNATQHITVKPSYGLEEAEIRQMLESSMEHARADMEARLLAETRVETTQMLLSLSHALAKDGHLLSADERDSIDKQFRLTEKAIISAKRSQLQHHAKALETLIERFAATRMNHHMGKALTGKRIEEVEELVASC